MNVDPNDPQVEQADGTFVSQSDLVAAVLGGAQAPAPKLLDAHGHEAKPDAQLLGPGGEAIDAELDIPDQRLVIDELGGRPPIDEILASLHRAEMEDEAQAQAEAHPFPEVEALIPWDVAPALSWLLTLRWRDDGALEAYWLQGDRRLPAHELDGGASMEFFYACYKLPGGRDSEDPDPETVVFQRTYGQRLASPWDFDFAVWWFTWFADQLRENDPVTYPVLPAVISEEDKLELAKLERTSRDVSRIKLHPHPLAVAVRIEIVRSEKQLKRLEAA